MQQVPAGQRHAAIPPARQGGRDCRTPAESRLGFRVGLKQEVTAALERSPDRGEQRRFVEVEVGHQIPPLHPCVEGQQVGCDRLDFDAAFTRESPAPPQPRGGDVDGGHVPSFFRQVDGIPSGSRGQAQGASRLQFSHRLHEKGHRFPVGLEFLRPVPGLPFLLGRW